MPKKKFGNKKSNLKPTLSHHHPYYCIASPRLHQKLTHPVQPPWLAKPKNSIAKLSYVPPGREENPQASQRNRWSTALNHQRLPIHHHMSSIGSPQAIIGLAFAGFCHEKFGFLTITAHQYPSVDTSRSFRHHPTYFTWAFRHYLYCPHPPLFLLVNATLVWSTSIHAWVSVFIYLLAKQGFIFLVRLCVTVIMKNHELMLLKASYFWYHHLQGYLSNYNLEQCLLTVIFEIFRGMMQKRYILVKLRIYLYLYFNLLFIN